MLALLIRWIFQFYYFLEVEKKILEANFGIPLLIVAILGVILLPPYKCSLSYSINWWWIRKGFLIYTWYLPHHRDSSFTYCDFRFSSIGYLILMLKHQSAFSLVSVTKLQRLLVKHLYYSWHLAISGEWVMNAALKH